jgi:hypothetical protein
LFPVGKAVQVLLELGLVVLSRDIVVAHGVVGEVGWWM